LALLLTAAEVAPLLDLRQAMAVLERVYRRQAEGQLDETPPLRLMGRQIRLVAGGLPADNRLGVRLGAGAGHGDGALALVYDHDGTLLTIMGYPFSELRLAATMALAVDRLAPAGATRIGLIGSGRLAPHALAGAREVRPIDHVAVFSPNPEHRTHFAGHHGAAVAASPQEALDGADVVLVSTNSAVATLHGRWLLPNQAVFGCGRPNELDDDVYLRAGLITVSSKLHEQGYYDTALDRPLIRLTSSGALSWDAVAELGHVITGAVQPQGMPVFRESQGGFSDMALAAHAYQQAAAAGLGREASF
jgi:alanine dehydrogenase